MNLVGVRKVATFVVVYLSTVPFLYFNPDKAEAYFYFIVSLYGLMVGGNVVSKFSKTSEGVTYEQSNK